VHYVDVEMDSNLRLSGESVEGVLKLSRLATVVDELWFLTMDGRWHTRQDLAGESSFEPEAVNAALRFLVKYGFAQSLGEAEERIRRNDCPSPEEVAGMLASLVFDEEQRFAWIEAGSTWA
jgi:hypothetical protein